MPRDQFLELFKVYVVDQGRPATVGSILVGDRDGTLAGLKHRDAVLVDGLAAIGPQHPHQLLVRDGPLTGGDRDGLAALDLERLSAATPLANML